MNKTKVVLWAIVGLLALSLVLRFAVLSQAGVAGGWIFYLGLPIGGIVALIVLLLRLGLLNFGESSSAAVQHWQYNTGVQGAPDGACVAGSTDIATPAGTRGPAEQRCHFGHRVRRKACADHLRHLILSGSTDPGHLRHQLVAKPLDEADGIRCARHRTDVDHVDAQFGVALEAFQVCVDVAERVSE